MHKIALVAISGVRVKDQELAQVGLTLPGFIERSRVISSLPSLGLLTLAAHVPNNWECTYIEASESIDPAYTRILTDGYDVVAISSLAARIDDAYHLADRLRKNGRFVAMGGLHVTACPQEAAQHADTIIQGEGERAIHACLKDFENGTTRAVYNSLQTPGLRFDFKDSKVPRYDLLNLSKYNRLTIQTSRGCPLNCSFCAASKTISTYKKKPIKHIRSELDAILKIWPDAFIELADDNTFIDKRWSKELVQLLSEYPFKWFTESDISVADNDSLLEALADSGCAQVLIGFESVNQAPLVSIDQNNWKARRWSRYIESIRKIQSFGISVNGCFILGHDGDDPSVFQKTYEFIQESGLSEVQITLLTPFPGTDLYHRLNREDRLFKETFWDQCTLFDLTFHPKGMSAEQLTTGFRQLMVDLYNPEATWQRKRAFAQQRRLRNHETNR